MAVAAFNCSTSIALYNAHDAAFRQRWKVKWSGEGQRCFFFCKNRVLNFYRLPFTSTFILLLVFLHSIQSTRSLFVFKLLREAFRTVVVTVVFLFLKTKPHTVFK